MTVQLVMDALLMVILRRGRPEAVLHLTEIAWLRLQYESPRQLLG
jgi:hypothetical protein